MPVDGLDLETQCYLVQGTTFEVDKRYNLIELMSHGAYGIVCSAEDRRGGKKSVCKIEGVFEHVTIAKRCLRELRILRHLDHENLIRIQNIFITGRRFEFEEIYVVCGLMEHDLATTLQSPEPLSDGHCQFFLYQILRGILYVHSAKVIHRDLKPQNLLVNSNCDLKICNFGFARVQSSDQDWVCPMTEYVCTRWYRAPEVLCPLSTYSDAIDIWSIGCILAEMHTRKPLFPGHNTQHQLDLIISLLGSPLEPMKISNDKCRNFIKSLPKKPPRPFAEVFTDVSPETHDLMALMLQWGPERRIPAHRAIQHSYLEQLHCPEDEPTREPIDMSSFEFERRKITAQALREEIFHEILCYYPDLLDQYNEEMKGESPCGISKYRLLVPGESPDSSEGEERSDSD